MHDPLPFSATSAICGLEDLEVIREELARRGRPTRLVRAQVQGEEDVRLQVGALRALVVELLGPFEDTVCGDCWQAVRVEPASRVVWCGPLRACPVSTVVGFVEDLLGQDVERLSGRYRRLG